MKHDIETALKMLDARGGDLDKEAARIIRKLRTLPFGSNPVERDLTREDISEMMYAAKLAGVRAELDATKRRLAKLEDEKAAADGWKPRMTDKDGNPHSWAEYDLIAAKDLLLDALGRVRDGSKTVWEGEVHTLASELRTAHITLLTEHRGALRELGEVVAKLGKELREHEGDFDDTDTALLLADEAAFAIRALRCRNFEKDARIKKLMDRQQGLMNAVVDAQHERGAFAAPKDGDVSRETRRGQRWSDADIQRFQTIKEDAFFKACVDASNGGSGGDVSRETMPTLQVDGHEPFALPELPKAGSVVRVSRETSRDDLDYLKMEDGPPPVEKIESWHDLVQRKIAEKCAEHALAQALTRVGVKVEE